MEIFFIIFNILMSKFSASIIWLKKSMNHDYLQLPKFSHFSFFMETPKPDKAVAFYSIQNKYTLVCT